MKKWSSKRLVIIPVVAGHGPYTVKAFALFFIESYHVHGNDLDVTGRFVNTTILGKEFGGYVGNYGLRVTKLTR